MPATKAHILSRLQKDILLLQGFKPAGTITNNAGLDSIKESFPNSCFPLGVVHEFFCTGNEDATATAAFIAGITSFLMKKGGASVWISSEKIFPPALKTFGIQPDKIIFINLKSNKEKLWVLEEALKCDSICSVIAEISEISFTESRRLQLAVEQSKVTGFLLRMNPKNLSTACVTRWKIQPMPGEITGLPGVNFPKWNVELLKVRNGKAGTWMMEWNNKNFRLVQKQIIIEEISQRKIV